jgi:hypothetical protein
MSPPRARLGSGQEVSTWAQRCRSDWEARFDRMDDYLARLAPPPGTDQHDD